MRSISLFTMIILSGSVSAQDSAPSSHMVFDDPWAGDIVINEVRVPKDGATMFTYYEALGWRGKGAGYAGIQVHPKARNFIFSIWDHKDHTAPIRAVHHGPGTKTVGFGGEGTGLKSWNFELGWNTDVWYTLVARNWPVDDHTHFGFWARAGDTKRWTHLVTMDVAAPQAKFRGSTDAFIEDWLNTGVKRRVTHLRNGWKRDTEGKWHPFRKARYSVNAWDLVKGKRSFNFRENWNGGVAEDETGRFYYMVAGGKQTKPTASSPSQHSIPRTEDKPDFPVVKMEKISATVADGKLVLQWERDAKSSPLFAYEVEVFSAGGAERKLLKESKMIRPHGRQWSIDLSALEGKPASVRLTCTDIFDQTSKPATVNVAD